MAGLVHAIRTSDNLEEVAESIAEGGKYGLGPFGEQGSGGSGADNAPRNTKRRYGGAEGGENAWNTVDRADSLHFDNNRPPTPPLTEATFESEISHKMSQLRVDAESGQVRFIGGTSNLILLPAHQQPKGELDVRSRAISPMTDFGIPRSLSDPYASSRERNPVLSWTIVLSDEKVILHLVNM